MTQADLKMLKSSAKNKTQVFAETSISNWRRIFLTLAGGQRMATWCFSRTILIRRKMPSLQLARGQDGEKLKIEVFKTVRNFVRRVVEVEVG